MRDKTIKIKGITTEFRWTSSLKLFFRYKQWHASFYVVLWIMTKRERLTYHAGSIFATRFWHEQNSNNKWTSWNFIKNDACHAVTLWVWTCISFYMYNSSQSEYCQQNIYGTFLRKRMYSGHIIYAQIPTIWTTDHIETEAIIYKVKQYNHVNIQHMKL